MVVPRSSGLLAELPGQSGRRAAIIRRLVQDQLKLWFTPQAEARIQRSGSRATWQRHSRDGAVCAFAEDATCKGFRPRLVAAPGPNRARLRQSRHRTSSLSSLACLYGRLGPHNLITIKGWRL